MHQKCAICLGPLWTIILQDKDWVRMGGGCGGGTGRRAWRIVSLFLACSVTAGLHPAANAVVGDTMRPIYNTVVHYTLTLWGITQEEVWHNGRHGIVRSTDPTLRAASRDSEPAWGWWGQKTKAPSRTCISCAYMHRIKSFYGKTNTERVTLRWFDVSKGRTSPLS